MGKRRGDGEGSIFQRKDGRWAAQVTAGRGPDGKMRYKTLYGQTRLAVSEALKKVLREQQVGLNIVPQRQTVGSFLKSWLESTAKLKNRPGTVRSYTWLIQRHLVPGIGKVQLDKLAPQNVREFLAERHATGLSAATVKHLRATLRSALSHAEREGLVHRNVAKLVAVPTVERYKAKVLAPEDARQFLKIAVVSKLGPLFALTLSTGLRRGEVLALRWEDIDFAESTLHVRHSLDRRKGAGLVLSEPKSERSQRALRLPAIAVQALRDQQGRQAMAREWAGSSWREQGFVFTTSIGTPLPPEQVNPELAKVLAAAKLPAIRFHDLRHSAATLLLSQGVHLKLISETLGHSTFTLTANTYSHMLPAMRNEVADRMDDVFTVNDTVNPSAERVQ